MVELQDHQEGNKGLQSLQGTGCCCINYMDKTTGYQVLEQPCHTIQDCYIHCQSARIINPIRRSQPMRAAALPSNKFVNWDATTCKL